MYWAGKKMINGESANAAPSCAPVIAPTIVSSRPLEVHALAVGISPPSPDVARSNDVETGEHLLGPVVLQAAVQFGLVALDFLFDN